MSGFVFCKHGLTKNCLLCAIERDEPHREAERLRARIEELEQCLRLNLAVAPNDPILVTPAERRVAELEAINANWRQTVTELVRQLTVDDATIRRLAGDVVKLERRAMAEAALVKQR